MSDLRASLELLVEMAPKLRAAGVTELEGFGLMLKLAPHVEADPGPLVAVTPNDEKDAKAAEEQDWRESLGLPPDAPMPGFTRPPDLERKADG